MQPRSLNGPPARCIQVLEPVPVHNLTFVSTVDIIVRPAVPFQAMHRIRIEKDIDGVSFRLASIEDLISLKTGTGGKHDASDIEALRVVARVTGKGI